MKWFLNLATRMKLVWGFGAMLSLLFVVLCVAYSGISTIRNSQSALFKENFLEVRELAEFRVDQNRTRAQLLEMMMIKEREKQRNLERDIRSQASRVDASMKRIGEALKGHPEELKKLDEMLILIKVYRKTREEQIQLIYNGKNEEAIRLALGEQEENHERIRVLAQEIEEASLKEAGDMVVQTERKTQELSLLFISVAVCAVLLGAGVTVFLNDSIAKPLDRITAAARKIAKGELNNDLVDEVREDEVGSLQKSFSLMNHYLKDIAEISQQIAEGNLEVRVEPKGEADVLGNAYAEMLAYLQRMAEVSEQISRGDLSVSVAPLSEKDMLGNAYAAMLRYLREMATLSGKIAGGDLTVTIEPISAKDMLGNAYAEMVRNLRQVSLEIRDGVNILASATAEIQVAMTQVASSMTETASSVAETTATVEEVKQTVQLSVEKSKGVSESAQKATVIARQGNEAVKETLLNINNVRVLMKSVVESIVRLSEQTQTIGEIIATVNDLAQQSNLLAVNAAIEASKAGEQGRGFTVVAQEIKSLAEQSKQATEQIKSILDDIQKATRVSVLAAEQVSGAVEGGVKQADESGESIRHLADGIAESAQTAIQISASSQQQLAGMEQVAQAMESIKQAARQNLSGTKQAENAAQNLNELGQKLKRIVDVYRV